MIERNICSSIIVVIATVIDLSEAVSSLKRKEPRTTKARREGKNKWIAVLVDSQRLDCSVLGAFGIGWRTGPLAPGPVGPVRAQRDLVSSRYLFRLVLP